MTGANVVIGCEILTGLELVEVVMFFLENMQVTKTVVNKMFS